MNVSCATGSGRRVISVTIGVSMAASSGLRWRLALKTARRALLIGGAAASRSVDRAHPAINPVTQQADPNISTE